MSFVQETVQNPQKIFILLSYEKAANIQNWEAGTAAL